MKFDFPPEKYDIHMTFSLFSLILLTNKSEHMVQIDNVISMDFAKTPVLALLSKSSTCNSR